MGKENKSLYWYGFRAKLKKGFGRFFTFIGGLIVLVSLASESSYGIFVGIILSAIGIFMWATGSSQRFDYQRESGSILHRGDF